jgi:hypothetical protein
MGMDMGTNFYPQPLYWRVGNCSTRPKPDPLPSLLRSLEHLSSKTAPKSKLRDFIEKTFSNNSPKDLFFMPPKPTSIIDRLAEWPRVTVIVGQKLIKPKAVIGIKLKKTI